MYFFIYNGLLFPLLFFTLPCCLDLSDIGTIICLFVPSTLFNTFDLQPNNDFFIRFST